ncbi:MAG: hypothetical protein WEF50_14760 [Myxococcota bacterium]
MDLDKLISAAGRPLFILALVLLGLAGAERLANVAGYTITRSSFTAGRLLEISALLATFVIAILLRQIRDEARARH